MSYGVETIAYDANGNRKQKSGPGVPLETYTWNALDQLVRIGVSYLYVTFDFDYAGRRIAKEVNGEPLSRILYFSEFAETEGGTLTKHFYAGGVLIASSHVDVSLAGSPAPAFEIPLEEWLVFGSVASVLLLGAGLPLLRVAPERVLAVRAVGAVLLMLSAGPPVLLLPTPAAAGGGGGGPPPPYLGMRHYHVDRLGSTQVVTDDLGAVLQQVRYDAYGAIRTRVDANGDPLDPGPGGLSNDARRTFTGYEDEWLSGLQYAGARFYDPELGQFLTHDPAGQFPSPYAYGPGDPINGTDPTGALFGLDLIALAIVIGVSTAFAAAQAHVFGGNPLKAGLMAAGMGVLGAGLGIAAGAAGAAIGTDSQVMGLLTNPLVQDSLMAASAGLPVASAAAGDDAGVALGILSAALSLSLAFSAGASSVANGAEAGSEKSQSGDNQYAANSNGVLTDTQTPAPEGWTYDQAVESARGPQIQEANIAGAAARVLGAAGKLVWNGAKYVWKNTNFDGPSPGAYHLNGRIAGVRWKQSQWGARLDIHPLDPGGPPVLHVNYGPLGKGEAPHVKLFDPRWLDRK